jgi:hypothetical protein
VSAFNDIEIGDMAFFVDGGAAVGAVRKISNGSVSIYVENAGEFYIPNSSISSVHSHKVILIHKMMTEQFLLATRHAHEGEHDAE